MRTLNKLHFACQILNFEESFDEDENKDLDVAIESKLEDKHVVGIRSQEKIFLQIRNWNRHY